MGLARNATPALVQPTPLEGGEELCVRLVAPQGSTVLARITETPIIVGSNASCHLSIGSDRQVAAEHLSLFWNGEDIVVRDLGAPAGTFLLDAGGRRCGRIDQVRLQPGAELLVGSARIRLERQLPAAPQVPGQFGIVGDSPEIRAVFEEIHLFGPANGPVWIWGESGVGKGMIARALHARSPRHDKPFAHYACGNIRQHIEDTLFGHGKATFTGVPEDRAGAFLLADHGMFFLDECDGLDEAIQERLLIVSEQGWFRPLGADERVDVDVRMIMASKVAPWELVRQKKLREDVAERLARFQIRVPSLRERRSDLRHLVPYLLGKDENGKHLVCSPKAMKLLHKLELPGNVRGLENLLCNAALRARGSGVILPEHVQAALVHRGPSGPATAEAGPAFRVGDRLMTEAEHKAEYRRYVIRGTGSKVAAAKSLGLARSTLDGYSKADGSPAKMKPKGRRR